MHRYDVAFIGGDAGGLLAAVVAAQPGYEAALLGKEKRLDRVVAANTETVFLELPVKKGRIAGANADANHAGEVIHGRVLALQENDTFNNNAACKCLSGLFAA